MCSDSAVRGVPPPDTAWHCCVWQNTSCPGNKSSIWGHLPPLSPITSGDRHETHNTPSPLTILGTALTYTMSYEFPTFHPLQTIFCIFRSWSVSHRHLTSEDVPMGGGTPSKKMEKRHSRCTPVLHPVQKRCEPSKTSIGVHRLWIFYPAEKKIHFEFFFEIYRKNVEKYNINRGYSVMKNNFLADKNAFTVISIRVLPLSEL